MKGKTIRIYLADGTPNGLRTAEIINWSGKVLVAPRTGLADLVNRPEVGRTGVYCLVGADPENSAKTRIYVGEGDSVRKRLVGHDKKAVMDFWTSTAVIISKDENLTKSHARYLESRLLLMAREAERALIANHTSPDPPPLPEPDVADMEFFLNYVQMIMPVLGFSFLQPKPTLATADDEISTSFEISISGTCARAVEVDGELVVLKGSTARMHGVPSWTSFRGLRDQLVADGKLMISDDPEYYVFVEDIPFSSPSAAASVVVAANTNGRVSWRVSSSNQSYADWHNELLQNANVQDPDHEDGE